MHDNEELLDIVLAYGEAKHLSDIYARRNFYFANKNLRPKSVQDGGWIRPQRVLNADQ